MLIRLATLDDVEQIMVLTAGVVPGMRAAGNYQWDSLYPNPKVFETDIAKHQLWVATDGDTIAGVAALTMDQDAEYADVGWDIAEPAIVTHRLAVSINYQGKGVAAALLLKAEEVALSRNIDVLRIDTNNLNQATQKLFPKLGYVYAGEISLAFRPGLLFYCYEKRLNRA